MRCAIPMAVVLRLFQACEVGAEGRRERAGYGAGAGLHHEEGARVVASLNHHEADGAEGEVGVRSNC